jgi:peptidoglycan/LPS O-acetylase OafA/YrhL
MSVVFYHINGYVMVKSGRPTGADALTRVFDLGAFGVQLFFVISGFIIAHPFARRLLAGDHDLRLKHYYLRRLTRLEPPYFINLLLIFTLLIAVNGADLAMLFPHLAASLTYLHNVVYGGHSLVNGVAWSLEVECQFYLLAPLLVSVFRIRNAGARRLLLIAGIAFSSWASVVLLDGHPRLELSVLNFAGYFLAGFLLADLHLADWLERPSATPAGDLLSLAGWAAIPLLLQGSAGWQGLLPFAILAAYVGAFRGQASAKLFTFTPVYLIGGMCYTIYLYHFFVVSAVGRLLPRAIFGLPPGVAVLAAATLIVPVVTLAGSAIFVLLEKPFMQMRWHRAVIARLGLA